MNRGSNISAIIIAKDEAKYIGQCIDSLKTVSDEIIVVDSFSSDGTVDIAELKGAVVYKKQWKGYAATKNWGNEKATNPWILSIDADEVISEELKSSILQEKHSGLENNIVYKWNRLNNYCGTWIKRAGWYPDTKVRLFQKSIAKWEGEVHETLQYSKPIVERWLSGDLLHYTIVSPEDHLSRLLKYNKLAKPYPNKTFAALAAISTFLRMYFLKLGILDGLAGFNLCWISARGKWLRV